jgi:hypothetical protein
METAARVRVLEEHADGEARDHDRPGGGDRRHAVDPRALADEDPVDDVIQGRDEETADGGKAEFGEEATRGSRTHRYGAIHEYSVFLRSS